MPGRFERDHDGRSAGRTAGRSAGRSASRATPGGGNGSPARRPAAGAGSDPADPATGRTPARRPGRAAAPRPVAPDLPAELADGALAKELPPDVRAELRGLPSERRQVIAAHLAAAGVLLAEDPEAAYRHAAYARDSAARLPVLREAAGVAAYRTGRYAEALADLRAYTRMTGDARHLPVMADCERGLGRPERALALARSSQSATLDAAVRCELRIVAAGARRDLGDLPGALVELRGERLEGDPSPQAARLWYAYADALLAAGRREEATDWFAAAAAADTDGTTDAELRLADLQDPQAPPTT